MDGADVCGTSSRASRRPPDVISTIAILNLRWRRRKWRHPGPGARFSTPIEEWGGKWRPLRFRSPSWVTSFVGTGNEVIQDGRRKRKGRHFPPHSSMGIEKRALSYWRCCSWSICSHDTHACISDTACFRRWANEFLRPRRIRPTATLGQPIIAVWDGWNSYPFPNFACFTFDIWKWINKFIHTQQCM